MINKRDNNNKTVLWCNSDLLLEWFSVKINTNINLDHNNYYDCADVTIFHVHNVIIIMPIKFFINYLFLQISALKIFEEVGSFLNGRTKGHSFLTIDSFVLIWPLQDSKISMLKLSNKITKGRSWCCFWIPAAIIVHQNPIMPDDLASYEPAED